MKKIFYFLLILISLPFIATIIINIIYKKDIKKEIIKIIDNSQNLDAEIGKVNLSLIKEFPNATITINKIESEDIKIDKINVIVNPYKLLKKDIYIKKIKISNSDISNIENIIESFKLNSTNKNINHLSINNIIINNCHLSHVASDSNNIYKLFFSKIKLNGNKKNNKMHFTSNGVFKLNEVKYKNNNYNIKEEINFNTEVVLDQYIEIKNCQLQIDNHIIKLNYNQNDKINIITNNIDYNWIYNLIPHDLKEKMNKMNLNGNVNIKYKHDTLFFDSKNTSMKYKNYIIDDIIYEAKYIKNKLLFKSNKTTIKYKNYVITNLSCDSEYYRDTIKTKLFKGLLFNDQINGNFILTKIHQNPKINLNIYGNINSSNINNIFPDINIIFKSDTSAAKTYINGKYIGYIGVKNPLIQDFLNGYKKLNINQQYTTIKPNNNFPLMKNFFIKSQLIKNEFYILQSSFNTENSDFKIEGKLEDISPIFNDNTYTLTCNLVSEKIKFKDFLNNKKTDSTSLKSIIPEKANLSINTNIKKFNFEQFWAREIKGDVLIKNETIYGNNFNFESCEGNIESNYTIENNKNKYLFTTNFSMENINIKKMFHQFDDFSQNNVKHNNIAGILDGNIYLQQEWDYNFTGNYNKFYSFCDIKIKEGELIDYEPLLALEKYIPLDAIKHLYFSTLENQIEIKNKKIKIPFMEIKSSAIDIAGTGTHHFNDCFQTSKNTNCQNKIKYEFQVFLKDILSQEIQNNKKINEDFGYIEYEENTGTVLYLKMIGSSQNPIVKPAGIELKATLNDSKRKSKNEIKEIFQKTIKEENNKNIDLEKILEWPDEK